MTEFVNMLPAHLAMATEHGQHYPHPPCPIVYDAKRPVSVLPELGISLKAIGRDIGLDISARDGELLTHPLSAATSYHQVIWRKSLTINSSFCRALVQSGYLSWQQMVDAVCRYRLGGTRSGRVIFWQIDNDERICDGKVMSYGPDCHRRKEKEYTPTWVSALLTKRHGGKQESDMVRHCLFGLHLLKDRDLQPVAVVEAEKTAVILSAYYPQYVWLATGGLFEVQPEKFRPLKGRKVILFPDADPDGKAYAYWYEAAQLVMAQPYWEDSPPIRVSALLEQHATPEQKRRKIDLVEFITESKENYHYHGKF